MEGFAQILIPLYRSPLLRLSVLWHSLRVLAEGAVALAARLRLSSAAKQHEDGIQTKLAFLVLLLRLGIENLEDFKLNLTSSQQLCKSPISQSPPASERYSRIRSSCVVAFVSLSRFSLLYSWALCRVSPFHFMKYTG